MTPEAKQLLKDKPELCKYVVIAFRDSQGYANPHDEDFDESWEYFTGLHTAKDWEILSFKDYEGNFFNLFPNKKYGCISEGNWSLDQMLPHLVEGIASIHSVRRLSDNEVFTEDMDTDLGKIKGFQISKSNEMVVDVQMESGLTPVSLACITKRTPLFITEDGKDYYKGDTLIPVRVETLTIEPETNIYYGFIPAGHVVFSTREAAEQWVEDRRMDFVRNAHKRIILQDNIELKYVTWENKTPWQRLKRLI